VSSFSLSLGEDDLQRIADAVAAKLSVAPQLERPESVKRWYSVEEAATYTSLTAGAIRMAVKKKKLEATKGPSGRVVFSRTQLDLFMGGAVE
jgi:excisionase family DNA binding protein